MVGPLGFSLEQKQLKRAGLDYWPELACQVYENRMAWQQQIVDPSRVFYFTTKAQQSFYDIRVKAGDWLVFGKETKGLEESLLKENWSQAVTLPFPGKIRSFNLANAVAMALGEGLRQLRSQDL